MEVVTTPIGQCTVRGSRAIWTSNDGSQTWYEVALDNGSGQLVKRKTKSSAIGQGGGQSFDLVEYSQKNTRNNTEEKFVKQAPKEGFASSPAQTSMAEPRQATGGGSGTQFKADPEKQASIERQSYFKSSIDMVANFYTKVGYPDNIKTIRDYTDLVVRESRHAMKEMSHTSTGGDILPSEADVEAVMAAEFPGAQEVLSEGQGSLI